MVFPKSAHQQNQRTSTAGRIVVYFLLACSSILLYNSFQLESFRFEALIRDSMTTSSRVLPAEDDKIGNVGNSEFYVPSLDYRIMGVSQYSNSVKAVFEAHIYCQEFEKNLLWEWWGPDDEYDQEEKQRRLLRQKTSTDIPAGNQVRTTRKRLLIGLSSGYDDNAKLLEQAAWSARLYAQLWSEKSRGNGIENMDVTVVVLQGTAFSPHGCKSPSSHSSIDKIRVLFEAIDSEKHYDRLLLLDPDSMIYDMDSDLTSLIDNDDFVVMGSPLLGEDGKKDKSRPWEISSGITFWNLEHPLTRTVALDWFKFAKNGIIRGSYQSDQKYLHKTLQQFYNTNQDGLVERSEDRTIGMIQYLEGNKFGQDSRGTIVKQFGVQSASDLQNESPDIEARLARMEDTAEEICGRYPKACKKIEAPTYETS